METPQDIPDNIPCPYRGAADPPDGEFRAACHMQLHIPAEARAAASMTGTTF